MKKYLLLNWKQNLLFFILTLIFSVLFSLSSVVLTFVLNNLINLNFKKTFLWLIVNLILTLLAYVFTYLRMIYQEKLIQKTMIQIKMETLSNIENMDYETFHNKNDNEYVAWLNTDMSIIENQGLKNFYLLIYHYTVMVCSIVALLFYNYYFILLSLFIAMCMLYTPVIFKKRMEINTEGVSKNSEASMSNITQLINGFNSLYSLNKVKLLSKYSKKYFQGVADSKVKQMKTSRLLYFILQTIQTLGEVSIILLTAALAVSKLITPGSIFSTINLAGMLYDSIVQSSSLQSDINSIDSVFNKIQKNNKIDIFEKDNKEKISPLKNELCLKNLSYNYGEKIIHYPDMIFERGKKYAIIGESGSGKSTFMNILNGYFNHYNGTFLYDGMDKKTIRNSTYLDSVSYVSQKPYLFNMSIRENLCLNDEYTDEELKNILRKVKFSDSLLEFPNGLDTMVVNNGTNFSGGQVQRIALARTLLREKSILFLDEFTSSLDKENALYIEKEILKNKDLTVVMITHRIHSETKALFDEIYEL